MKDPEQLSAMAELLDINRENLEKSLCHRVIAARGEVMEKGHTEEQAYYGRDAFAKVGFGGSCIVGPGPIISIQSQPMLPIFVVCQYWQTFPKMSILQYCATDSVRCTVYCTSCKCYTIV